MFIYKNIFYRFVEEGGVNTVLTLLLAGAGNLAVNPRPVRSQDCHILVYCYK